MPETCDECFAQVAKADWFQHRGWHQDQEALTESQESSIADAVEDAIKEMPTEDDLDTLRSAIDTLKENFREILEDQRSA